MASSRGAQDCCSTGNWRLERKRST
uniref:Uncharacterized protein n=1 Tax=Arundo donax TaxID=35708 RepID=A0A0A9DV67_ARUDO